MLLHCSIMIGVDIQWMLAMSSSTFLQLLARKHKNHSGIQAYTLSPLCVYQIKHPVAITFVLSLCLVQFVCNQDLICQLGSLIMCAYLSYTVYVFSFASIAHLANHSHPKSRNTKNTPSLALAGCGGGG